MARATPALRYTVELHSPAAHLFRVTLTIPAPDQAGITLQLPAWIPGSYMIREFSKNIVEIEAKQGGRSVSLRKRDKHTWVSKTLRSDATLEVSYLVYAWDLSVRCAHLDQTHAFFNGTQMFLSVLGREAQPHEVLLVAPKGRAYADWRVATTLPLARGKDGAKLGGFGLYRAPDYDTLVDHPVEMGTFESVRFKAGGVSHEMAITGRVRFDAKRLAEDLAKVCQWQIDFFGGEAPFRRYLFLTMAVGDGYGGLEHRDSTALLCSRNDLPAPGATSQGEAYRGFLGLCSHEYFHAWNVKRIQPAAFRPYRLHEENYTRLLWVFEGFTSYYDDIALLRSGVITQQDYLALIAKCIKGVEAGNGRHRQSVSESSFDAWTKYYRQDENAPNAIVSYYTKGTLIALGLDLTIREATRGRRSLDDVMRHLWQHYAQAGRGVAEDEMPAIIKTATGVDVHDEIALWVEGTLDVPLEALLGRFGVKLTRKAGSLSAGLGVKSRGENGALKLLSVFDGGAAQAAGLSAGDELIALDGLRVNAGNLDAVLARYRPGEHIAVTAFRRDELMQFALQFARPPLDGVELQLTEKPLASTLRLRNAWLGQM